jgi:hypothetical protein
MKIRFAFLLLVVGSIATSSSCTQRSLNALNPCTINGVVQNVPVNPQRALDLLIVIDDSPSMQDEQEKLAEQVPRLVNLLLTGGEDTDGSTPVGEFPAIESLHVAVITPDLGHSTVPAHEFTAGSGMSVDFNPTTTCMRNNGSGKAGFMQVTGFTLPDRAECSAQTPPDGTLYLNINPDSSFTPQEFVDDVECITGQGAPPDDWGCGFEQQLESVLASDRNTANAGFSREDALLAVILITDEDDCSTTDPRVFDVEARASNPFQGPFTTLDELQFNLRCYEHSEALQDVQRYVDGVAALKSDPSQVVFAAITGIPEDADLDRENFNSDEERYQAILGHPDMQEVPDPNPESYEPQPDTAGQQLRPACTSTVEGQTERSRAFPGRRIVETMDGLARDNTGVGTVVESICAEDFSPALNAIVDRIAAALRQLCLPRPLNRDSQNLVGCEVREVQPEGVTCADAGNGREPEAVGVEDGREVCRVTQLPSDPSAGIPEGQGWFYDDFTAETVSACSFNPEQQRVSFTEGAAPVTGARIRFECLQAAPPTTEDIGWPCTQDSMCDPNPDNCEDGETIEECETRILKERYDRDNLELVCDTESNTCQLTCESNVQCPGGFACYDANEDGNSYCVNPTCTLN